MDRCGSLWVVPGFSNYVVVDRCGSLWVVPGFSNYAFSLRLLLLNDFMRLLESEESQLAELPGQSALISGK